MGGRFSWRTLADVGGGTLSLFLGFIPLFAAQWLVLRRHISRVDLWVLSSSGGICLGTYAQHAVIFVFGIVAATTSGDSQAFGVLYSTQLWGRTLGLFALWGIIGAAQWLVLRRRIRHAGWWVLASAVGGATSGAVALVIVSAGGDLLLSYLARWAVYGALTGVVLVLLLQNRIKHRYQRHIERAAVSWSASWPGLDAYTHGKTRRQGPETKHLHLTDTGPDRTVGARLSSPRPLSIRVREKRRTPGAVSRK
jgi:hypothetical protein